MEVVALSVFSKVSHNNCLLVCGVVDFLLMAQKQTQPSRPHLLLPIFISNADEQDTHSMEQGYIYKCMYSELKTALLSKVKEFLARKAGRF